MEVFFLGICAEFGYFAFVKKQLNFNTKIMIQRIQSLYLLGSAILIALCIYIPIVELSGSTGEIYQFTMKGYYALHGNEKEMVQPLVSLAVAGYLMLGLLLVTIFLYKARRIQMRLSIYAMVLQLGLGFIFLYITKSVKTELAASVYYHLTVLFPFIGAILTFLAFRSIKKDEEMVKSYDRIR